MIKTLVLKPLKIALNNLIQQDEDSYAKLRELNLCMQVQILPLNNKIYLTLLQGVISLSGEPSAYDLEVTVRPSAVVKMQAKSIAYCIKNKDIIINGDVHLLLKLQEIFKQFDLDIESKLANVLGDFITANLMHGAKKIRKGVRRARRDFALDCQEFLQDELQVVVTREEVANFIAEVDAARLALDRLEAKISLL